MVWETNALCSLQAVYLGDTGRGCFGHGLQCRLPAGSGWRRAGTLFACSSQHYQPSQSALVCILQAASPSRQDDLPLTDEIRDLGGQQ